MHLGAFEATLVMLGSSPPSLSLLLGVIRGSGLSFGFQESTYTCNVWLFILSQFSFFLSCCILSSPSVLCRGNFSLSVWVHLRGIELTADWFEYHIRET